MDIVINWIDGLTGWELLLLYIAGYAVLYTVLLAVVTYHNWAMGMEPFIAVRYALRDIEWQMYAAIAFWPFYGFVVFPLLAVALVVAIVGVIVVGSSALVVGTFYLILNYIGKQVRKEH